MISLPSVLGDAEFFVHVARQDESGRTSRAVVCGMVRVTSSAGTTYLESGPFGRNGWEASILP